VVSMTPPVRPGPVGPGPMRYSPNVGEEEYLRSMMGVGKVRAQPYKRTRR
jgi:hypothetical protein